jgi:thiol:disulfide interchange protein DsbD
MMDYGYQGDVLFPLKLRVVDGIKTDLVTLHVSVDWLVCKDSCIPGKAELEEQRVVETGTKNTRYEPSPLFTRFFDRIPKPLPAGADPRFQAVKSGFRLSIETGKPELSAQFFPSEPDVVENSASQIFTRTAQGFSLDLKKDESLTANPTQLSGVIELSGGRAYAIRALPQGAAALLPKPPVSVITALSKSTSITIQHAPAPPAALSAPAESQAFSWATLLSTIGIAYLGGLLLNLMPCVFPVLFLKGLALVNSGSEDRRRMRIHGFVYAGGILVSFWALVAILQGARAAGAKLGWGFQFQSPIFLELIAGLLFFLGMSLAGQFEIGITFTGIGNSLAGRKGYFGSFFTGVLAVVVATPCTAPFMGVAIGYALAQPALVTFTVFTALGLGLSAPYLALAQHPAWTRLLPRPGAWMDLFRHAVSLPIFATVIWLMWVLAQAYGANIAASLLANFLLLAIAGYFLGRWPTKRWAAAVSSLLILSVIGIAVSSSTLFSSSDIQPELSVRSASDPATGAIWEPWSAELVRRYQAQGRPVFVDFTAGWCLSCQVNERAVLHQASVQQAFQANHVALLRADWTRHDEAITQALASVGRSGVPAYVFYNPGQEKPLLLPEVLTPGVVLQALAHVDVHSTDHRGQ